MQELRFGVIGCGSMGKLHCSNASFVPGMKTVAYCDVESSRADAFLSTFGGEYATHDAERIFADPTLHGVMIQTGEVQHPQLVIGAAQAGKHIFCEKPLARTLEEARHAVDVVEQSGVKFVFGACNRLAPMVQRAKQIVPHPVYSFCQCAETVTAQAVHNLDLAVHLFHEAPLVKVYAQGQQVWGLDPHLPADSFVATLTFADGSVHCYIQHGASRNGSLRKYHYQLFGTDRMVYLAERFKKCIVHNANGAVTQSFVFEGPDFGGEGVDDVRGPYGYMGHYDELAHLCDCIRTGATPQMTVRHGLMVLAVEKAILESITTGSPVDFTAFCNNHNI